MKREEIHRSFVAEFASGEPSPSDLNDLVRVEKELGTIFPQSFIEFMTAFGTVHTPSILDLVTGGESEIAPEGASFDVQEIMTPDAMLETTRMYHSAGMDESVVAIASDCMGNVFGFRKCTDTERPDDSSLVIFDHDFCEVSEEAESFDSWLKSFLDLKRSTEQSAG